MPQPPWAPGLRNARRSGEPTRLGLQNAICNPQHVAQVALEWYSRQRCVEAPGRTAPWLGLPPHQCASATAASLELVVISWLTCLPMIRGRGAYAPTVDQNLSRREIGDNALRRSIPSLQSLPLGTSFSAGSAERPAFV